MNEYDVALKLLLRASASSVIRQITGGLGIARWLNPEFPRVQARRADLLGLTSMGGLVHIELQSTNDLDMPLRMAEYALGAYRQFSQLPTQIVLYVGEAALRMTDALRGPDAANPDFAFRFTLADFRDLDGGLLLESENVEDNVLAILARLRNQIETVRHILERIAVLEEPSRHALLAQFLIVSGLRRLGETVKEEAQKMPILNDILTHEVIGPAILQGRREGRREGRQEGRLEILRRQLENRFGPLPEWVAARLQGLSASELDEAAIRVLDMRQIEELFPDR